MKHSDHLRAIILTVIIFCLFLLHQAHGQSLTPEIYYTSERQAGAGISFSLPSGYGAGISHFNDENWKGEDTTYFQNGTILSLSKRLLPMFGVSIGAGRFESYRHVSNNEYDQIKHFAVYQVGFDVKVWREVSILGGVMFGGELLQVYSGVGVNVFKTK